MKSLSFMMIILTASIASATDKDLECQSFAEFAKEITFPEPARFVTGEEKSNVAQGVLTHIDPNVSGKEIDLNKLRKQIEDSQVYLNHGKIASGYFFQQLSDIDVFVYVITKKTSFKIEPEYEKINQIAKEFLIDQKAKFLLYNFNISAKDFCRCHVDKSVRGWFTLNCKWSASPPNQIKVEF